MRIKADFILPAVLVATSVISSHAPKITPAGNLFLTAAVGVILPHSCKIVPAGNLLTTAAPIVIILSIPSKCDASVMEQLCSSVTSFLNDEAAKADADLKACKDKCGWKKRKDDLIDAARKKARDSCSKGEAPDINELNKGLDGNAKEKLKKLYDQNNRMFDGTAKLAAKDLTPVPSNSAATLTGKGGQVTDLKSYEPNTPKLNPTAEFSLSGTKLSGETSNPAAAKQSAGLLASAAQTKASADTTAGSSSKSPTAAAASDKATVSAAEPQTCAECKQVEPNSRRCLGICCAEAVKKYPKDAAKQSDCYTLCTGITAGATAQCKCCQDYNSLCTTFVSGCTSGCGPESGTFDWWHKLWGKQKCCRTWFNPKTKCCADEKIVDGVKCGAACYDPKKECCVKEKKIPETCTCYHVRKRLETVNKYLAGYNQPLHPPLSQTDPTATTIAMTSCLAVVNRPWTLYYPGFDTLDPIIKDGIIIHENEHRRQCINMGRKRFMELQKGKEYVLEIPAYEKERKFLDEKFTEKCK